MRRRRHELALQPVQLLEFANAPSLVSQSAPLDARGHTMEKGLEQVQLLRIAKARRINVQAPNTPTVPAGADSGR